MRKLTDQEREIRAERRHQLRRTVHWLSRLDALLSALAAIVLFIWLAVYIREGRLQGATASWLFWASLIAGVVLFVYLLMRLFRAAKVARKV